MGTKQPTSKQSTLDSLITVDKTKKQNITYSSFNQM